ncbi:MAG: PQQ-dependent sugar dehydrogenase [Dehalococcoidia bacterium]
MPSKSAGIVVAAAACATLLSSACGSGGGSATATSTSTPPPTSSPATPSAVPSANTPAENGYRLVPTLPQAAFDKMLGFQTIPGSPNEAVVLTQGGVIYRIALDGSVPPAVFGDVSGLIIPNPGTEEGLLGLAFSPHFESDGRVFVDYVAGNPTRDVLARFNVSGGAIDVGSERVILEVPEPFDNHKGGQLAFGPDGYLYWGLGDGGSEGDPQQNGQKLDTLLSSILRLDVSGDGYVVPPDNPFISVAGALPEKYAYGLRNPWRFSFDPATGDLWAGDVGQDKWEEIDRIVAGGNYGWSIMEGLECYRTPNCDQTGLTLPRAVYGHDVGCAIIGGYVYRGAAMPELDGWFVYGDYCSGRVWALDTQSNSAPVLLANSGHPITSFGVLPSGEIVALSFDKTIYALERAP